jgi:hypothetical protein
MDLQCLECGGRLVMFNLLMNEPKKKMWRCDAKLIGFEDPIGFRCGASRGCKNHYTVLHDELVVLRVETSYEPFKGIGTSEYWTIVKFWDADYHQGLCAEEEYPQFGDEDDFEQPTVADFDDLMHVQAGQLIDEYEYY